MKSMKTKTSKKWIQGAIKKPGALHKALGVKLGTKISVKKLAKGAKSKNPKIRKEVTFAKTLTKLARRK